MYAAGSARARRRRSSCSRARRAARSARDCSTSVRTTISRSPSPSASSRRACERSCAARRRARRRARPRRSESSPSTRARIRRRSRGRCSTSRPRSSVCSSRWPRIRARSSTAARSCAPAGPRSAIPTPNGSKRTWPACVRSSSTGAVPSSPTSAASATDSRDAQAKSVSDEPFIREERRLVTLVFADVVGSTALAEELDAEDVRALLSRYYAIAHEVVEAHGGAVAKLLGDGVLAVFGVPMAHGDDAQRALDASLALRGRVMPEEALARLQLRIGINTGEVVATQDARGEIVGDAVNAAARVAAAAEPDQILAADATHRAARSFEYGDLREIVAKGKSQPVRTWPVLRREAERATGAPFIGREDDLAQLELTARRAFRDRRPHLVTITAPTGVGKSRLVAEFRQRLPVDSWHAHTHCPPYGATAFAPLRELLVELLGLSADAPADDIRRHVGAVLEEVEAPRDGVLIAATVAPDAKTDEQDRDRIFAAWRRLLERLATERPMLLVLEDLQWASDSLLDLIEHVVQLASPVPLLVVCLARPELLQRRPTWGGGRRNTINFALEPLGADDVARLVTSLLEAEPPRRLRDLIVERADGNPYFAEELVRALLERGLDLKDPVAVDTALRALPETVQATVLARIDMLAPDERAVLQSGAVVGRSFDAQTLRVICQIDASGISAALERLVGRDLLTKSGEGAYAFGNALIREVAYGMLPRARRARDHAIVAQRLQTTAGERIEEFAALIGFHYLEATRLRRASAISIAIEGADEETTRAGAIIWLARSARANTTAGAWTEALAQLQDALGLATGDERIPLLVQLGETTAGMRSPRRCARGARRRTATRRWARGSSSTCSSCSSAPAFRYRPIGIRTRRRWSVSPQRRSISQIDAGTSSCRRRLWSRTRTWSARARGGPRSRYAAPAPRRSAPRASSNGTATGSSGPSRSTRGRPSSATSVTCAAGTTSRCCASAASISCRPSSGLTRIGRCRSTSSRSATSMARASTCCARSPSLSSRNCVRDPRRLSDWSSCSRGGLRRIGCSDAGTTSGTMRAR